MPRRPRIEIAGYYHIINRGVNRNVIFRDVKDYEYFLELLLLHSKTYGITIHNYCLMSNHYHLLLEITQSNLSKFMRQINGNYAIYFKNSISIIALVSPDPYTLYSYTLLYSTYPSRWRTI